VNTKQPDKTTKTSKDSIHPTQLAYKSTIHINIIRSCDSVFIIVLSYRQIYKDIIHMLLNHNTKVCLPQPFVLKKRVSET